MKFPPEIEQYRWKFPPSRPGQDGGFWIPGPVGRVLKVIASAGSVILDIPWEHVSVSAQKNCPSWREMCFIKNLFWDKEECVMQLHPPESQWVNNYPNCLHLWKPIGIRIPQPPAHLVGIKELGVL